jgi:hypothetical protein
VAIDVASITIVKQTRNDFVFIGLAEGSEDKHHKLGKVVTFEGTTVEIIQ